MLGLKLIQVSKRGPSGSLCCLILNNISDLDYKIHASLRIKSISEQKLNETYINWLRERKSSSWCLIISDKRAFSDNFLKIKDCFVKWIPLLWKWFSGVEHNDYVALHFKLCWSASINEMQLPIWKTGVTSQNFIYVIHKMIRTSKLFLMCGGSLLSAAFRLMLID